MESLTRKESLEMIRKLGATKEDIARIELIESDASLDFACESLGEQLQK